MPDARGSAPVLELESLLVRIIANADQFFQMMTSVEDRINSTTRMIEGLTPKINSKPLEEAGKSVDRFSECVVKSTDCLKTFNAEGQKTITLAGNIAKAMNDTTNSVTRATKSSTAAVNQASSVAAAAASAAVGAVVAGAPTVGNQVAQQAVAQAERIVQSATTQAREVQEILRDAGGRFREVPTSKAAMKRAAKAQAQAMAAMAPSIPITTPTVVPPPIIQPSIIPPPIIPPVVTGGASFAKKFVQPTMEAFASEEARREAEQRVKDIVNASKTGGTRIYGPGGHGRRGSLETGNIFEGAKNAVNFATKTVMGAVRSVFGGVRSVFETIEATGDKALAMSILTSLPGVTRAKPPSVLEKMMGSFIKPPFSPLPTANPAGPMITAVSAATKSTALVGPIRVVEAEVIRTSVESLVKVLNIPRIAADKQMRLLQGARSEFAGFGVPLQKEVGDIIRNTVSQNLGATVETIQGALNGALEGLRRNAAGKLVNRAGKFVRNPEVPALFQTTAPVHPMIARTSPALWLASWTAVLGSLPRLIVPIQPALGGISVSTRALDTNLNPMIGGHVRSLSTEMVRLSQSTISASTAWVYFGRATNASMAQVQAMMPKIIQLSALMNQMLLGLMAQGRIFSPKVPLLTGPSPEQTMKRLTHFAIPLPQVPFEEDKIRERMAELLRNRKMFSGISSTPTTSSAVPFIGPPMPPRFRMEEIAIRKALLESLPSRIMEMGSQVVSLPSRIRHVGSQFMSGAQHRYNPPLDAESLANPRVLSGVEALGSRFAGLDLWLGKTVSRFGLLRNENDKVIQKKKEKSGAALGLMGRFKELFSTLGQGNDTMGKTTNLLNVMGGGFSFLNLGLAGFGVLGLKAFAEFDDGLTRVMAHMRDWDQTSRNTLERGIERIRSSTSSLDLARGLDHLTMSGMNAAMGIRHLTEAENFSLSSGMQMAEATRRLVDIQRNLHMQSMDAQTDLQNFTRLADLMVGVGPMVGSSVQQMTDAMGSRLVHAAQRAKLPLEDVVALIGVYAERGIHGRDTSDYGSRALMEMSRRFTEHSMKWRALGVAIFDSAGRMRDLADIIDDISSKLPGFGLAQEDARLLAMGFDQRAISALEPLKDMGNRFRELRELARSGVTGVNEQFARMMRGDFLHQMRQFWKAFTDLAIAVGRVLAPVIEYLARTLESLLNWFVSLERDTQKWVVGITAVVLALGPLFGLLKMIMGLVFSGPIMGILGVAAGVLYLIEALAGQDAVDDFVKNTMGFMENFAHNMKVLMDWLVTNWGSVWAGMAAVVVAVFDTAAENIITSIQTILGKINLFGMAGMNSPRSIARVLQATERVELRLTEIRNVTGETRQEALNRFIPQLFPQGTNRTDAENRRRIAMQREFGISEMLLNAEERQAVTLNLRTQTTAHGGRDPQFTTLQEQLRARTPTVTPLTGLRFDTPIAGMNRTINTAGIAMGMAAASIHTAVSPFEVIAAQIRAIQPMFEYPHRLRNIFEQARTGEDAGPIPGMHPGFEFKQVSMERFMITGDTAEDLNYQQLVILRQMNERLAIIAQANTGMGRRPESMQPGPNFVGPPTPAPTMGP